MALIPPRNFKVLRIIFSVLQLSLFGYFTAIVHHLMPDKFKITRKKNISGQTVLITGAGSGIGKLLAIEFSKLSAVLVLLDLNEDALRDTKNALDGQAKAFLFKCDVSARETVYEVAAKIKSEVGKVDILVNNAGIVSGKRFLDLKDAEIQRTMEVNVLAHFWMCKAFLPDMIASNSGHVVSIASVAGVSGLPKLTDYCASKFAAVGLMESLRHELDAQGLQGVKLTTICPSLTATGLFEGTAPPLTVLMTPEYVVGEIMRAVLQETEFILLPYWMNYIILFKWIMPSIAVKKFFENSGLLTFMDSFKGRTVNNNSSHDKES